MVEVKSWKNASDAFDRDLTADVSKRFITRGDVASFERSICDPMEGT